jgi:DNA modification methylase
VKQNTERRGTVELNRIYNEDCIEGMKRIKDGSIDLILTDLPYGMTDCKWDSIIPFDVLWEQYNRIIKSNGAIVLFSIQPFTTKLIQSNFNNFKYCWYWKKNNKTGFTFAKFQPMRCIEDICVFYADKGNVGEYIELRKYLFDELNKSGLKRADVDRLLNNSMSSHYFTNGKQFTIPSEKDYKKLQSTGCFQRPYEDIRKEFAAQGKRAARPIYNPQGLKEFNKVVKGTGGKDSIYGIQKKTTFQKYTNYPVHLLQFDNEATSNKNRLHPTQKPLALCEYLIKTYTDAGETVLDSCAGSGTTLLAAKNTGRQYIGFETDPHYFNVCVDRLTG